MKKLLIFCIITALFLSCKSPVNNDNDNKEHKWIVLGNKDFSEGESIHLDLTLAKDGTPYVGYSSLDFEGGKASSMKFNGSSWVAAGNKGFSRGAVDSLSMAFANNGTLYMAYQDTSLSKGVAAKYVGGNWISDSPDQIFENGNITRTSIEVENNIPYVLYADMSARLIMKNFDGEFWVPIGNENIAGESVRDISMAIHNGTPYAAYQVANGETISVKKYNGTDWVLLGNENIAGDATSNLDLKISDNGDVYVAYEETPADTDNTVSVMKYDGSSWTHIGKKGFALPLSGSFRKVSLALYHNIPYVIFSDKEVQGKATVMKYNGADWEIVGQRGFSPDKADETCISISRYGVICIAYINADNGRITSMIYE